MPRNFCTLFDLSYLARGLLTHRSLRSALPDATVTVLCMDQPTKRLLDELDEPGMETIGIDELERDDPELARVRADRTRGEYCWTATPALCRYLFDRDPSAEEVTYLDADLMFFSSPEPLYEELGGASVAIVPHRYAPPWAAQERTHGIYNVEWVTFRRDGDGLRVLDWWRERCIEWCYARVEDGRFGDQKYLDEWPRRFAGVHVLQHPGAGVAPWNVPRHRIEEDGGAIVVDGRPLVFFHFHSLALHEPTVAVRALAALGLPLGPRLDDGVAWTTNYPLGDVDRGLIWRPYLRRLRSVVSELRKREPDVPPGFAPLDLRKVLHPIAAAAHGRTVRALEGALGMSTSGRRSSGAEWGDTAAREMLDLVRSQLAAPEAVPPFRAFRYALEAVVADNSLARPVRLLDIGCGVGHYSELVSRWFGDSVAYTGSDSSEAMVLAARTTFPGREFVRDDVLAPDVGYDGYDVLLAGALVDVLTERQQGLESLLRSRARYVILHRQRLTNGRTRTRPARGYAGRWTRRTVLARRDLDSLLARHEREVALRLPVEAGIETLVLRRRSL